ncbi:MAG: hypothetical protein ABL953_04575 [Ilumatobacteraceae bacterium]
MFIRRVVSIVCLLGLATACEVTTSAGPSQATEDVSVGGLPPTLPTLPPGETTTTVPRTTIPVMPALQIGSLVTRNRLLVIGDSIFASTAKRNGGEMCDALVPLGWGVEVDAERSRFIEFGHEVLSERLGAGWDAAVVLLGNNYGGFPNPFRRSLERLIERLAPRPVVLLTVSEWRAAQRDVNEIILDMPNLYDNVYILDWAAITAEHPEYLNGEDLLHPNPAGELALVNAVAAVLGPAPTPPGTCYPTNFFDDSGPGPSTTTTVEDTAPDTTPPDTPPDTTPPTST